MDAEVQAQSMAHRQAVSRSMVPVLRLELAEEVLPGALLEAAEVQSLARVQPSELPQAEEEEEVQP